MEETLNAMKALGFEPDEVEALKCIVAGFLHCGNISFEPNESQDGSDGSVVAGTSEKSVEKAAQLLGLDTSTLAQNLTTKPYKLKSSARQETVTMTMNPTKAATARDSLAKAAYGRLFKWLVARVNVALRPADNIKHLVLEETPIGILDIFGFEIFEHNHFEQLCINYANEKLQQHFTRHVFKMQEELYASEGIDFTFPAYGDNTDILALIEAKKVGIMSLLDEQLKMPSPTDKLYLSEVTKSNKGNPCLEIPRMADLHFTIVHYAGKVTYDTEGFIVKNRANLDAHLEDMLRSSSASIVRKLGDDPLEQGGSFSPSRSPGSHGVQKRDTQLSYFRKSLESLMGILERSEPHFIRCIKPNSKKKAKLFESPTTLEQLKYSGVVEAVQICKMGFPFRRVHEQFQLRYWHLLEKAKYPEPNSATKEEMVDFKQHLVLSEESRIAAAVARGEQASTNIFHDLQIGETLILYRVEQHHSLESLRFVMRDKKAVILQTSMRGKLCKVLRRKLLISRRKILEFSVAKDHVELRIAIEEAEILLFELPELNSAKDLLSRLEAAVALRLRLNEFLENEAKGQTKTPEDIQAVKVVANDMMTEARSLEIDDEPLCIRCSQTLQHIAAQLSVIATLNSALDASIKEGIAEILSTIETLEGVSGVFCDELKTRAVGELGRIEDEMILVTDVAEALIAGRALLRDTIEVENLDAASAAVGISDLFMTEGTNYGALYSEVQKLKEFGPRSPEGASILALGHAVVKLRSSVLSDNWLGIKAAVVDINGSAVSVQPIHANALEELKAAQIAIDIRDNIPALTKILQDNAIVNDPGVGRLQPRDMSVDHMSEAVREIQTLGTCTIMASRLLEQSSALIKVRQHWRDSNWKGMEEEIARALSLYDSRFIAFELEVASHEVYDRKLQATLLKYLMMNKMTGTADKCDKREISSTHLKVELEALETKGAPQSSATACLVFTSRSVSDVSIQSVYFGL